MAQHVNMIVQPGIVVTFREPPTLSHVGLRQVAVILVGNPTATRRESNQTESGDHQGVGIGFRDRTH